MKLRYVCLAWFLLGMAMIIAGEGLLERTWWGLALCLVCGLALGVLVKHEIILMKESNKTC